MLGCFISFRLLAFFYWLVLKVRTILFSFTESLLNLRHWTCKGQIDNVTCQLCLIQVIILNILIQNNVIFSGNQHCIIRGHRLDFSLMFFNTSMYYELNNTCVNIIHQCQLSTCTCIKHDFLGGGWVFMQRIGFKKPNNINM